MCQQINLKCLHIAVCYFVRDAIISNQVLGSACAQPFELLGQSSAKFQRRAQ